MLLRKLEGPLDGVLKFLVQAARNEPAIKTLALFGSRARVVYEHSWKVLKKALLAEGHQTQGARDVFQKAYQLGFISNESSWIQMIEDRNQTAHVYDEAHATQIVDRVRAIYLPLFDLLAQRISSPTN